MPHHGERPGIGVVDLYGRFEYTCNWVNPYIFGFYTGGVIASIANRLFTSPVVMLSRFQVIKLGVFIGATDTGNIMLSLYDHVANRPTNLQCGTAPTPVAGNANRLFWITPTTTPILPPGFYWLAGIPSISKVNANGMQFRMHVQNQSDAAAVLSWTDGEFHPAYYQDVGAFVLPDPMVPVTYSDIKSFGFGIKFMYV